MNSSRHIIAALATSALLATSGWAQDAPDAEARAFELNEQGILAFQEGRFEAAAQAFAEAYEITHDEALRKNEAMAWFKADQCEPAVDAANKYLLVEGVDEAERADALAVIANCKVEFARAALEAGDLELSESMLEDAEGAAPDPVVKDRISAVRIDIARERNAREEAAQAAPATDAGTTVPTVQVGARGPGDRSPGRPSWAVGMLAGGATTVGVALVYHLVALGWQREFLDMTTGGGDPQRFDSLRKRVHTARVLVPILYGVGAGVAGAGTWFTFFAAPATERSAAPTAGLVVGGTF